jgi:hypothetical protein
MTRQIGPIFPSDQNFLVIIPALVLQPRHNGKTVACDHEITDSHPENSLLHKCRERLRT